jgi:hypothetical protein
VCVSEETRQTTTTKRDNGTDGGGLGTPDEYRRMTLEQGNERMGTGIARMAVAVGVAAPTGASRADEKL